MVHRFTSVAFRLAAVWGCSAAFEVSGQTRIPVPGGAGCYSITDREACCLHTDGRIEDASYAGQDCVPSKPDVFFNVEHQVVCQPSCFVDGSCGDGGDHSAEVGECTLEPAPSPSTPSPAPLPPGTIEQFGALVPTGGELRFYAVGSSNAAWQTWPDQLHAMLKQLDYDVDLPPLDVPGEIVKPSKAPVCADAETYTHLQTPRLGMVGWSSWGFAYEDTEDCDAAGFREIAGYNVSCTNAWACNPQWTGRVPLVPISKLAAGVRHAHFVVLANWINDGKAAQASSARLACYQGVEITPMDTVAITEINLKRVIRAIHAENPNIVVLVLARYPDTRQVIYPNERTLPEVIALNEAVKEKVQDEPNTFFVDLDFPQGENMFQTLSKVHPNCRGDKMMATSVVDALFKHKVLSRGLELSDDSCLASSNCSSLSLACCQRSTLCYVANDGACASYGPGLQ
mmetsp:Transcript_23596/g.58816  ORF Transcript_23596/g.58816 Transcript_23596/m.58816 type:complete len:456 (-) Transcript_23596:319-1686(-)